MRFLHAKICKGNSQNHGKTISNLGQNSNTRQNIVIASN